VIVGAAFCPHPPVLVPQAARGAAQELHDLREACRTAVRAVALASDRIVLLGSGEQTLAHSFAAQGSLAGYGVDVHAGLVPDADGPVELPLSLTVGAWLVRETLGPSASMRAFSVGPDAAPVLHEVSRIAASDRVGLVVMGDGSARRTTAAPGYLDKRAVAFDDAVVDALRAGDADALAALDLEFARELLAAGAPAWRAAGQLLRGAACTADLGYYDAPYGVGYVVATWTARG
jgi:hypothetical protein